jgi:DNA-binding response OmpR family regulator
MRKKMEPGDMYTRQDRQLVLVVDPDTALCAHLREALRKSWRVEAVATLKQAKQFLMEAIPACIVLERELPDGDSVEWVRLVRATSPEVIIIFATRRASVRDKVIGLQAGADDYVVKPLTIDLFPTKLRLLVRIRGLALPGSRA